MIDEHTKEIIIKLILAIVIGIFIGGEREYRNKSAGLRTMILICLGSTLFTIVSFEMADETEATRIASNIVTGIGFLGAGAIMREGLTISGLTTASTIWVAAALGMAVGAGQFVLALIAMGIAFIVLTLFPQIQSIFEFLTKSIELHIVMKHSINPDKIIGEKKTDYNLKWKIKKQFRKNDESHYHYEVSGKEKDLLLLIKSLNECNEIESFEY